MGSYIPSTAAEQKAMLAEAGFSSFEDMYADVPREMLLKEGQLDLPHGMAEMEVRGKMEALAAKNKVFPHIFRGAGAYRHYIPSIVTSVVGKEEFLTAYTPYQAEISQGILQSIFEYQTMICQLTGMDVSNASVYDGATAAAEAVAMCRDRGRQTALVSACAPPQVIATIGTYCFGNGMELKLIPQKDGLTDMSALEGMIDGGTACVYIQQPNFFGCLEDAGRAARAAHSGKAKLIMGCNPISLGLLKSPGEYGADIAVGEGQPLGLPLAFGGPYLGFMAAGKDMMRKLPGRIAGQTADSRGQRGFVLTLQAREQHIRREKAGSNICSNQALCAMTASVYLSAMGSEGLRQAAESCMSKAHYLAEGLEKIGYKRLHDAPFFHEFVTSCPIDCHKAMAALADKGYLGGLPLEDGSILWCATEVNTKEEIDGLISILKEAEGI